jgi:hypothetical protein
LLIQTDDAQAVPAEVEVWHGLTAAREALAQLEAQVPGAIRITLILR